KFGPAALDAMHVGELRPLVLPEQRIEPGQGHGRVPDGDPLPPGSAIARLVQHAHHGVTVLALVVDVRWIQRKGEVMNVFGSKADTLPARSDGHSRTPWSGELGAVPLALVINAEILVGFRFFPARIALHRNARCADHLVRCEVERDIVGGELAVELAPRVKWVVFPAVAV